MEDLDKLKESAKVTQHGERRHTCGAFKLLRDPVLVKGGSKIYRYDGTIPHAPSYPPVILEDPRNPQRNQLIRNQIESLELSIPIFKVDANYIGVPPPLEVTMQNLSTNINTSRLRDLVTKYGEVEEVYVYYHPLSKKHLGLSHIAFESMKGAKMCVKDLSYSPMMGKTFEVFLDPFGKQCKLIYESLTAERKVDAPVIQQNGSIEKRKTDIPVSQTGNCVGNGHTPSDLGQSDISFERRSVSSEGRHSSISNHYGRSQPPISDTQIEDDDVPTMDLDSRIELLLLNENANYFRKLVGLTSSSESDSETKSSATPLPKQENKVAVKDSELCGSVIEEENVETAFAKKFRKDTFVPVEDENAMLDKDNTPPSPFLRHNYHTQKELIAKLSGNLNGLEHSVDEVGTGSAKYKYKEKYSAGSSSLSQNGEIEDPFLIELPPHLPPQPSDIPLPPDLPPLPDYPPPESYLAHGSYLSGDLLSYDPYYTYLNWNSESHSQEISFQPPLPLDPFYYEDKPPPPPESPNPDHDVQAFIDNTARLLLEHLVFELKTTLKKDLQKKVIQSVAYKQFDLWANDNEEKYKKQEEVNRIHLRQLIRNNVPQGIPKIEPKVNAGRFAFMTSITKLPSFRKIVRVAVKREELSAKSESYSDSESEIEEMRPQTKRNTRGHTSLSSESSISASSDESASELESVATSGLSLPSRISDKETLLPELSVLKKRTWKILSGAESISSESANELESVQESMKMENIVTKDQIKNDVIKSEDDLKETKIIDAVKVEVAELSEGEIPDSQEQEAPQIHLIDHNYSKAFTSPSPVSPLKGRRRKSPISTKVHLNDEPLFEKSNEKRKGGKYFKKRTKKEEMSNFFKFITQGVDEEDLMYLKKSYEKILSEDHSQSQDCWLNATHWVDYPATYNPLLKPDESRRVNLTGCARSEGFYRLTAEEKRKDKRQWGTAGNNMKRLAIAPVSVGYERPNKKQLSREVRSNQRRLISLLGNDVDSDILKTNKLMFRKKNLKFSRSRIHDWGLFAMEPIAADEMVIEYVGEKVRIFLSETREKHYESVGIGSSYLFRIDDEFVIDATMRGNVARFINHSCSPNCCAKIITIEGQKKIVIYSKQAIAVNEEITYDYKFPIEENKIQCLCGSPQCRGTLN